MVVARFDFTEYVEKVKHKNQIHRHCISKFSAKKLRFCDTLTFSIHKTKKNKKKKKKKYKGKLYLIYITGFFTQARPRIRNASLLGSSRVRV